MTKRIMASMLILIIAITTTPIIVQASQKATEIISVKNVNDSFDDGDRVVVKWKKVSKAKSYKIQYATDKRFRKMLK